MRLRTATYSVATAITVCSLLYVWMPSLQPNLSLSSMNESISWFPALLTNGFVCLGNSPLYLIVLVGLIAFLNRRRTATMVETWLAIDRGVGSFLYHVSRYSIGCL